MKIQTLFPLTKNSNPSSKGTAHCILSLYKGKIPTKISVTSRFSGNFLNNDLGRYFLSFNLKKQDTF